MSEDPKLFDAGDYNLFRYCHNDPIDMTDPMGLDEATGRLTSGTHDRVWDMDDRAYNNLMAAAQRNSSDGAIGVAALASTMTLQLALDPKLIDTGDYDLFRYCHNDPLDMTDPMGLAGEIPGGFCKAAHTIGFGT
jgi:hypothetical protein